jgi:hypothetical protein
MTESIDALEATPALDGNPAVIIAAVWAEALGLDDIDPETGFFDLGATSAMVLNVVRVLRRRWPRLQIVDVFSHPTVAMLTELLGDA